LAVSSIVWMIVKGPVLVFLLIKNQFNIAAR
jgi:hypothetical protein